MNIESQIRLLNGFIKEGQILEAMEIFYHDEVSMQENESPPTLGKSANLEREKEFISNIVEWRSSEVQAVAVGSEVSMVEWHFDYTHKQWGVRNYRQVSVQKWKDGKIIEEKFYYGA